MNRTPHRLWRLCCAGAILLSVITFTPLVIRPGQIEPRLFGLPHTLWAGMLVAFGLVLLTLVGSLVHPARHEEEGRP